MHGGNIYDKTIDYDFSVNLNPLGCPEAVRTALANSLAHADRYPDPEQREARRLIARAEGVEETQVIGGNGASELISGIVRMLRPKRVLLATPGFTGYRHALFAMPDCRVDTYELKEEKDFLLDEGILDRITSACDLLILANPNNPTGRCIDAPLLDRIAERCAETETAFLLDESFLKMTGNGVSLTNRIDNYDGLYIVSGYTKLFALPGVRIGYAVSQEQNIRRLAKNLPEWNMSVMAQETACEAARVLAETDFMKQTLATIEAERAFLSNELEKLGVRVFPSDTSFLLLQSGRALYGPLLEKRILVRGCGDYDGLSERFTRVAVKDHEANIALLEALTEIMRE